MDARHRLDHACLSVIFKPTPRLSNKQPQPNPQPNPTAIDANSNATLYCLELTNTRRPKPSEILIKERLGRHKTDRETGRVPQSRQWYLFAESRADGGVAVLSKAHLEGDVQGHGVLVLGETFDDGDSLLHGFVHAEKAQRCP